MERLKKIAPERSHIMLLASSEAAVSPNDENSYNIFINQSQNDYYKEHLIRTLYDMHLTVSLLTVLLGIVCH